MDWGCLTNRSICVAVGEILSSPRRVTSGVPEELVLRPHIFSSIQCVSTFFNGSLIIVIMTKKDNTLKCSGRVDF